MGRLRANAAHYYITVIQKKKNRPWILKHWCLEMPCVFEMSGKNKTGLRWRKNNTGANKKLLLMLKAGSALYES